MLYPPTCVGCRYGRPRPSLEAFPGSMGSPASPCGFVSRLGPSCRAGLHARRPTRFHGDVQNPARLPFSVAPSVVTVRGRYRNFRLLRIGYASRPRLSSRLTLEDSLPQETSGIRRRRFPRRCRYSCQHPRSRRGPRGCRPSASPRAGTLPYRRTRSGPPLRRSA